MNQIPVSNLDLAVQELRRVSLLPEREQEPAILAILQESVAARRANARVPERIVRLAR